MTKTSINLRPPDTNHSNHVVDNDMGKVYDLCHGSFFDAILSVVALYLEN